MWSTRLTAAKTGKVLTLPIYLSQCQITSPCSLKIPCLSSTLFIFLAIMTKMSLSLGNGMNSHPLENHAFPALLSKHIRPLFSGIVSTAQDLRAVG